MLRPLLPFLGFALIAQPVPINPAGTWGGVVKLPNGMSLGLQVTLKGGGTEVWRLNGEVRYAALREYLHLVSFGAAAFWDSGRAWGPGAELEPWHHDAGFGVRISLPHSTVNTVAR